jgi:hypothetical protein
MEFEGTVDGGTFEGAYYPFDAPVKGKRIAKDIAKD